MWSVTSAAAGMLYVMPGHVMLTDQSRRTYVARQLCRTESSRLRLQIFIFTDEGTNVNVPNVVKIQNFQHFIRSS